MFDLSTDLETFIFDDRDCHCHRAYPKPISSIHLAKFDLFEPLVVEFGIKGHSSHFKFEVKRNSSCINDEVNVTSAEEKWRRDAIYSAGLTEGRRMSVRAQFHRSFSTLSEVFRYDLSDIPSVG